MKTKIITGIVIAVIIGATVFYYMHIVHTISDDASVVVENSVNGENDSAEREAVAQTHDDMQRLAEIENSVQHEKNDTHLRLRSRHGFSIFYKDDGIETIFAQGDDADEPVDIMAFDLSRRFNDLAENASESVQDEVDILSEYYMNYPLIVNVYEPRNGVDDLRTFASLSLLEGDLSVDGLPDVVVDHQDWSEKEFAQRTWVGLTRAMHAEETSPSLHFTYEDFFLFDNGVVYHISQRLIDEDFATQYENDDIVALLQSIREDVATIMSGFVFDDSKINDVVGVQKNTAHINEEDMAEMETLLTQLRQPPYFDTTKEYDIAQDEQCGDVVARDKMDHYAQGYIEAPSGMYFVADCISTLSDGNDVCASIHAVDTQGSHTGQIGVGQMSMEERAQGFAMLHMGFGRYAIATHGDGVGEVEIRGTDYGTVNLSITGDGNSCTYAKPFFVVTPTTIATIPVRADGSVGPISYDIDGDGVEDMHISLTHPLTDQKIDEMVTVWRHIGSLDTRF